MLPEGDNDLKVFNHHIYECRRGLRNLVLYTLPMSLKVWAEARPARDKHPIHRPASEQSEDKPVFRGEGLC